MDFFTVICLLFDLAYIEKQRRDWSVAEDMDHAQIVREMAFSGAYKEKPAQIEQQINHEHLIRAHHHLHNPLSHLEEAKIEAFSPPKQDRATARGIVQFMTPNTLSANVW